MVYSADSIQLDIFYPSPMVQADKPAVGCRRAVPSVTSSRRHSPSTPPHPTLSLSLSLSLSRPCPSMSPQRGVPACVIPAEEEASGERSEMEFISVADLNFVALK